MSKIRSKTITLSSGPPWDLDCTIDPVGRDYLCRLHGGDRHVGAVALSHWDGERAHTETLVAGRHKEGPIAEHSAHKLCLATHRTVTCISGIHYDSLTSEQIEEIMRSSYELVKRAADRLHDQRLRESLDAPGSTYTRVVSDLADLTVEIEEFLATPLDTLLERNRDRVTEAHRRHFGRKVLLFAPLYLSNACLNDCAYCGFRHGMRFKRTRLDVCQAVEEARFLATEGHRTIDLVTGETPSRTFITYLCEVIREIRDATPIERINLNLGALSEESYSRLLDAGGTGYHLYQETYDPETYFRFHGAGPKRDMEHRLEAPDRAAAGGFRFLGLGILLGLTRPACDLAALIRHSEIILADRPEVAIGFSLPRIQAAAGQSAFAVEHPVPDEEFIKVMLFLRLRFPEAHLTLTTRETPEIRDLLAPLGITKLSAGVSTAPGGYSVAPEGEVPQFAIHDERTLADVAETVRELGMHPVCS